jgi:hypothetical protein
MARRVDTARLHEFIREMLVQKPSEHLFRKNYQPQRGCRPSAAKKLI